MATKEKKPRPKRSRAKQGSLAGMEPPSIPEIEKAAEQYCDVRDDRMALTKQEVEKASILMEHMRRHELRVYKLPDGRTVEIDSLEKIKVRKPKTEGE